jgi:hypothetical protein
MNWKTKRAVGTALAATIPYFGMAFVGWDIAWPLATETTRYFLLFFTGSAAAVTYTYPGWRW